MARIARNRAHLGLPADTLLTPGTFDQEIAIPQRRELLSVLSILRLKIAIPFDQLISIPQHIGTLLRFQGLRERENTEKVLSFLKGIDYTNVRKRCQYPC